MCGDPKLLEGQVAIVTGASRGIGAATAKLLAAQGAKVAVNYRESRERAEAVLAEIRYHGGEGIVAQADVTVRAQVEALVRETQERLGPVDILVNNAAIPFPTVPFAEYRWEDFERKVAGEMAACFHPCQVVLPGMVARGRGCIVNVSSGLSRTPSPGYCSHAAAKSALDAFSKSLAAELGPAGIRVNVVAPGLTDTDATAFVPEPVREMIAQHTPLRRIGRPEDAAGAVLLCCVDWSRFVTGAYLPVSGGAHMP
ncbi:MAG: 3-oxoacyl-ACP reductase FabG [Acidobacteria bacterium]|nr:3-oxoacyl-ACP reductase FabG [Acidobacteriota bacterium]